MMKSTLSILGLVSAFVFSGSLAASRAEDAKLVPIKVGTLKMASLTDVWVAKQAKIFAKKTGSMRSWRSSRTATRRSPLTEAAMWTSSCGSRAAR